MPELAPEQKEDVWAALQNQAVIAVVAVALGEKCSLLLGPTAKEKQSSWGKNSVYKLIIRAEEARGSYKFT